MKIEDIDFEQLIKDLKPVSSFYIFSHLERVMKEYNGGKDNSYYTIEAIVNVLRSLGYFTNSNGWFPPDMKFTL